MKNRAPAWASIVARTAWLAALLIAGCAPSEQNLERRFTCTQESESCRLTPSPGLDCPTGAFEITLHRTLRTPFVTGGESCVKCHGSDSAEGGTPPPLAAEDVVTAYEAVIPRLDEGRTTNSLLYQKALDPNHGPPVTGAAAAADLGDSLALFRSYEEECRRSGTLPGPTPTGTSSPSPTPTGTSSPTSRQCQGANLTEFTQKVVTPISKLSCRSCHQDKPSGWSYLSDSAKFCAKVVEFEKQAPGVQIHCATTGCNKGPHGGQPRMSTSGGIDWKTWLTTTLKLPK